MKKWIPAAATAAGAYLIAIEIVIVVSINVILNKKVFETSG